MLVFQLLFQLRQVFFQQFFGEAFQFVFGFETHLGHGHAVCWCRLGEPHHLIHFNVADAHQIAIGAAAEFLFALFGQLEAVGRHFDVVTQHGFLLFFARFFIQTFAGHDFHLLLRALVDVVACQVFGGDVYPLIAKTTFNQMRGIAGLACQGIVHRHTQRMLAVELVYGFAQFTFTCMIAIARTRCQCRDQTQSN